MKKGEDQEIDRDREPTLPMVIKVWFAVDAIVALAPPLYWWADGRTLPIAGIPAALFYFLAVGLCITLSIIVADFTTQSEDVLS